MDWKTILGIAEAALAVIVFFAAAYYRRSAVLRGFIAELIADAEEEFAKQEKAGALKMAWVIDQLYAYVPIVFKPILTRKAIETAVQYVFDQIARFTDIQVAKLKAQYEAKKKK